MSWKTCRYASRNKTLRRRQTPKQWEIKVWAIGTQPGVLTHPPSPRRIRTKVFLDGINPGHLDSNSDSELCPVCAQWLLRLSRCTRCPLANETKALEVTTHFIHGTSPPFGMLATKPWLHSSLDNYMKLADFTLQCQPNKVFLRTYSHNLCYVAVGS